MGAVEKELISLRPDPTESSWTDDFEQNKILTALAELDPQQVKKSLQALGAGILGQRSEKSSSLEEKLLFPLAVLLLPQLSVTVEAEPCSANRTTG